MVIKQILMETTVRCDHFDREDKDGCCEKTFPLFERIEHLRKCDFKMVSCKFCKEERFQKFQEEHMTKCPEKPVACENKNCTEKSILRKDYDDHYNNCEHRKVTCPGEKLGCPTHVTKKIYDKHVKSCVYVILLP
eukprot:UN20395